jgi:hypothetical protein
VLRCCVRKEESVERESEMRRSDAVSLEILKWDVHWEISYAGVRKRVVVFWGERSGHTAAGSSSRSIVKKNCWSRLPAVLYR